MTYSIQAENLTKKFGARTILHNFSLQVKQGESIAITGPSGSGKSTLLNMIGLLEAPTSGTLLINSKPAPSVNSPAATLVRRNDLNYIFQSYALIPEMTVLDNILLALHYQKESENKKKERINHLATRLHIAHLLHEKVNTLSGGEQQRVALIRSILKPGNIILADEPTGALDPELAQIVTEEMLSLQRENGKTLVVVTHDEQVAQACDRQIELLPHTTEHPQRFGE